jgi:acyl carrier protein
MFNKKEFQVHTVTDTKKKIMTYIMDYFVKDSNFALKDDTSLLDEGLIDSTGVMELVAFLETNFDVKVEDEEIVPDNFDSINKLLNFVQQKLNGKSHSI